MNESEICELIKNGSLDDQFFNSSSREEMMEALKEKGEKIPSDDDLDDIVESCAKGFRLLGDINRKKLDDDSTKLIAGGTKLGLLENYVTRTCMFDSICDLEFRPK